MTPSQPLRRDIVGQFHSRLRARITGALTITALAGLLLTAGCGSKPEGQTSKPVGAETAAAYEQHLSRANALFKEDKLEAALAETRSAIKLDDSRYEAHATAALILHATGKLTEAGAAINEAARRAPTDKRAKVEAVAKAIGATLTQPAAATVQKADEPLTGATRRQFNSLMLIIDEAQQATEVSTREKLLREFLDKSAEFVRENPSIMQVWSLRASIALELNNPRTGWEAGQQLVRLGADDSQDAATQEVMAKLDRKGWLAKDYADVETAQKAAEASKRGEALNFVQGAWGCKFDYDDDGWLNSSSIRIRFKLEDSQVASFESDTDTISSKAQDRLRFEYRTKAPGNYVRKYYDGSTLRSETTGSLKLDRWHLSDNGYILFIVTSGVATKSERGAEPKVENIGEVFAFLFDRDNTRLISVRSDEIPQNPQELLSRFRNVQSSVNRFIYTRQ